MTDPIFNRAMKRLKRYGGWTSDGCVEAIRRGGCELSPSQRRAIFAREDHRNFRALRRDEFAALLTGLDMLEALPEENLVANGWASAEET